MILGATQMFQARGSAPALAKQQAYELMYSGVARQAAMLAYVDTFRILAFLILLLVPVVFIVRKPKPGAPVPVH